MQRNDDEKEGGEVKGLRLGLGLEKSRLIQRNPD
jgi:hypothetical protein